MLLIVIFQHSTWCVISDYPYSLFISIGQFIKYDAYSYITKV